MTNLLFASLGLTVTLMGLRAAAASPSDPQCAAQLAVQLTPGVPDARDSGFLGSLLNNHPTYRLDLLRQEDSTLIEVGLAGPRPANQCQTVVETIRKDARVLSIRVNPANLGNASVVGGESTRGRVQVSEAGLGSLYWAARHPHDAWRVLLPIRSGDSLGDEGPNAVSPPTNWVISTSSATHKRISQKPAAVAVAGLLQTNSNGAVTRSANASQNRVSSETLATQGSTDGSP